MVIFCDLKSVGDVENAVNSRVIESLSRPYELEGIAIDVTVSIGVTIYPFDAADEPDMVRHADYAMYAAKRNGKNRMQFRFGK